jgi:hypothetical protein
VTVSIGEFLLARTLRRVYDADPSRTNPRPDSSYAGRRDLLVEVGQLANLAAVPCWTADDPDKPAMRVAYLSLPTGQVSWHYCADDIEVTATFGVTGYTVPAWDGHTTDEKYSRVLRYVHQVSCRITRGMPGNDAARLLSIAGLYTTLPGGPGFHPARNLEAGVVFAATGGRGETSGFLPGAVASALDYAAEACGGVSSVHAGDATGIDGRVHDWARARGLRDTVHVADWSMGLRGGPARNRRMLERARPDFLVAFPGGAGTRDCVNQAEKLGITVLSFGRGWRPPRR